MSSESWDKAVDACEGMNHKVMLTATFSSYEAREMLRAYMRRWERLLNSSMDTELFGQPEEED